MVALIKILPKHYKADFLSGELYLNTTSFFNKLEGDGARSDHHEGANSAFSPKKFEVKGEDGSWLEITGLDTPITIKNFDSAAFHMLCFYGLTEDGIADDSRIDEFGDTCVVVLQPNELLERIRVEVERLSLKLKHQPVEYVKFGYNGPMGPFRKVERYGWQSEYRVTIHGADTANPLRLSIGSLEDIALEVPTASIRARLKWRDKK